MFCFAKQKLLITSSNSVYEATAFYKSLRPNCFATSHTRNTLNEIALRVHSKIEICQNESRYLISRLVRRLLHLTRNIRFREKKNL